MALVDKDLQFLHRPIFIGSVILLCAVWSVYIPMKVAGVLPPHFTWFKIICAPLLLPYIMFAITIVPSLGMKLGVSGRSWRFMFLFLLYHVPPLFILLMVAGLSG